MGPFHSLWFEIWYSAYASSTVCFLLLVLYFRELSSTNLLRYQGITVYDPDLNSETNNP